MNCCVTVKTFLEPEKRTSAVLLKKPPERNKRSTYQIYVHPLKAQTIDDRTHQRKSVRGVGTRDLRKNEAKNGSDGRKLHQDFGHLIRHAADQGRAPSLEKHKNRLKLHRQVLTIHNSFQSPFDSQCFCCEDVNCRECLQTFRRFKFNLKITNNLQSLYSHSHHY